MILNAYKQEFKSESLNSRNKMVLEHNFVYCEKDQFFVDPLATPYHESLKNLLCKYQNNQQPNQKLSVLLNFGSFYNSGLTVQQIIQLYQEVIVKNCPIKNVELLVSFNSRLLSPNELAYVLAMIPHVFINSTRVEKTTSEIKLPSNFDLKNLSVVTNSSLLELIVALTQSERKQSINARDQLQNANSASLREIAQLEAAEKIRKSVGNDSWKFDQGVFEDAVRVSSVTDFVTMKAGSSHQLDSCVDQAQGQAPGQAIASSASQLNPANSNQSITSTPQTPKQNTLGVGSKRRVPSKLFLSNVNLAWSKDNLAGMNAAGSAAVKDDEDDIIINLRIDQRKE